MIAPTFTPLPNGEGEAGWGFGLGTLAPTAVHPHPTLSSMVRDS